MKQGFCAAVVFVLLLSGIPWQPATAAPTGAIFTTTANGSRVNANLYSSKCEVYLDGGPGPNAPADAAGLPDGEYYFQVTDPSGKQLLSTDPVSNRRFLVDRGVIVAYTGFGGPAHPTGYDQDHPELGATTIRLAHGNCPADFLDSPNAAGAYKVWITPVEDFVGNPADVDTECGSGCHHGFLPSKSKTDAFKAKAGSSTFCLTVWKRIIDQGVESPGAQWMITVLDPLGVENPYYTGPDGFVRACGLSEGNYTVTEDTSGGFQTAALIVNGITVPTEPGYTFSWSPGKPELVIIFKNSTGFIGEPQD